MIFGECPYDDCDEPFMTPIAPGDLPRFEKHSCEKCGRAIWTMHSRLDPKSWTEDSLLEDFTVDPVTRVISPKDPNYFKLRA